MNKITSEDDVFKIISNCVRCDVLFIKPMYHKKPNILYFKHSQLYVSKIYLIEKYVWCA